MRVAVPCHAFCRHPVLRAELLAVCDDVQFNDEFQRFTERELADWLAGCDAAIIALEPVTEACLAAAPQLKIISKYGVGIDNLDATVLNRHGIRLGWQGGTNALSVAELTLCFAIAGLRHVGASSSAIRAGARPTAMMGRHLSGRTVGVHGCGHVGKQVIRLLAPFGCDILACDIVDHADFYRENHVTSVTFDELLDRSEVLTLHLPLTDRTRTLYDAAVLSRLRPDCVLINTCRGGIVDEVSLKTILAENRITAACFDVFAEEPPTDEKLLTLPNFLATPHLAGSAEEARLAMGRAAIRGLFENSIPVPGQSPFD
jgi:D-3-phosphoglycerate dehydrogenase